MSGDLPPAAIAILEATRQVITRRGPDKFRISAVATASGVSRPTLYKYFPTKDDLLSALTGYEKERFDRHLHEVIEAEGTPAGRLDAALRCLITYLDGLMGPDPLGTDLAFALGSLHESLEPQSAAFAALLGDALDAIPAVQAGHLSRVGASELFIRIAYSHFLIPHPEPEDLLTDLRHLAGLPAAPRKTAAKTKTKTSTTSNAKGRT